MPACIHRQAKLISLIQFFVVFVCFGIYRWIGLAFLSVIFPCLCLYPACHGCHKIGISCGICGGKHRPQMWSIRNSCSWLCSMWLHHFWRVGCLSGDVMNTETACWREFVNISFLANVTRLNFIEDKREILKWKNSLERLQILSNSRRGTDNPIL